MDSKVLIIDDEVELLELLRLMVSNKQVQVFTARDSEQALQLFHAERPTIVFCDYLMPKMDGIELMERFLAIDPEVDVVIFTGVGSVDSAVKAIKMGAYDYVTKPMDIGKISMIIDRIIESQTLISSVAVKKCRLCFSRSNRLPAAIRPYSSPVKAALARNWSPMRFTIPASEKGNRLSR
jgi:DNA-binding NtrC family response regulator